MGAFKPRQSEGSGDVGISKGIKVLLSSTYASPIGDKLNKLVDLGLQMESGLEECFNTCAIGFVHLSSNDKVKEEEKNQPSSNSSKADSSVVPSIEAIDIIENYYNDQVANLSSVLGEESMLFASSIILYANRQTNPLEIDQMKRSSIYQSIIRSLCRADNVTQVKSFNQVVESQLIKIEKARKGEVFIYSNVGEETVFGDLRFREIGRPPFRA